MWRGSAATDQYSAYFTTSGFNRVYRYIFSTDKWETLPPCPYRNSGLVVIDNILTAIGGGDVSGCTNKLFTLRQSHWKEVFPPMITARFRAAVVSFSDGHHMNIVVIGGRSDGGQCTTAVEFLNTHSQHWFTLSSLPEPHRFLSAAVSENQLFVIGLHGRAYVCSLKALPTGSQQIQLMSPALVWTTLPRLPVKGSTATTLCGQLVSIGGGQNSESADSILQLVDEQWVKVGSLSSAREMCLAISPSPDKVLVVGGWQCTSPTFQTTYLDSVELCTP